MSRRRTIRHSLGPLGPTAFARRLPSALGTLRAQRLLSEAMEVVEITGKPDGWIREVQRAQDRGAISAAVARFLIFHFVESALTMLSEVHPHLRSIRAALERVERDNGLGEDEYWHTDEGPPEWQALNREWEAAADEIMAEIFRRHGELELAENPRVEGDPLFLEGKDSFFPPDADETALPDEDPGGALPPD